MADRDRGYGEPELEILEIELLLEGIHRHYGFDFRGYAYSSLKRRLWRVMAEEHLSTVSELQSRVLHDEACMERLLRALSINVTAMFRDPDFFVAFRDKVAPLLRTYPCIRVWNAGCSTGEETYSLAILLAEEGLYERTRIYATDINDAVLERAEAGDFPVEKASEYAQNYLKAGGSGAFSDYYATREGTARLSRRLKDNVVFAQHNLVSDRSFNEFHVILCRNVMIYFGRPLQDRVHGLFYDSLDRLGILGLGQKESIRLTRYEGYYEPLDVHHRLYRRIG